MINVSQAIKNSCKADKNSHTEYIVINNRTIYIEGKLSATAYKDSSFFGTFNMKVLQFETENTTQFRNRQFEYYKVIDGNAFKIGTFITTEVVDNDSKETVKVTANDYALKFAVPYTTSLDYSSGEITMFDVLEECCANAGVQLENQTLTNGDFIVDSNQFVNNELIGDVISAIAGMSCNFATITEQDKLKLLFYEETNEILSDYTDLNDKRDTHPITSVSIGMSQVQGVEAVLRDENLIEQYGEHWLILNDNPLAYTLEKRQQLVTAIFNKVKGFGYSSFTSKYTYRPYLGLGDKIKFKNKAGELIDSIILRYTMNFDDCTFEAPSITSSEVDYQKSPSPEETAKRAEIIANQAEASITNIVSEIDTIQTQINGQYFLTSDTTFQDNKQYYIKSGNDYIEYSDYEVGDTIPANTIYEFSSQNSLEERVRQAELNITSQGARLDIATTNIDPVTGDVLALKRTNYEIGQYGIITTGDDGYKAVRNTTGDYFYDNDVMVGKYTKDGSVQKNITLYGKYYYGVRETLNVETFTKDDAMFIAELYTDNDGNVGMGHFYNQS